MSIQESGQMYLKTIYQLGKEKEHIKSIDIAKRLNYSKPSVSRAIHLLEKDGFITISDREDIQLTDKGMNVASSLVDKYEIIVEALMLLGVPEIVAREDACKIEHDISKDSINALKVALKK